MSALNPTRSRLWNAWFGGTSLRSLAIRSSAWTVLGYGASQVLRLASNVILARLLVPDAFGLMALVLVVQGALQMFSDIGIGLSIIQHKRGKEETFVNTAWTIQLIRGVALWICACLLTWPVAALFARTDPLAWQLVSLLPAASLIMVFNGGRSIAIYTLNRSLRMGRLTVMELAGQIVASLTMIGIALIVQSVWALVIGTVAGSIVTMILSHRLDASVKMKLAWDRECAREIYHFGKWIFLSTIVTFLAMNTDRILLGNLVPLDLLGVYSFGLMVATLPRELMNRLQGAVLFPALTEQHRRDESQFGANLARAKQAVLAPAAALVLATIVFAPPFFTILYKTEYHDAGWIAQLVAIGMWFTILQQTNSNALLAAGKPKSLPVSNVANLVVTIAACLIGHQQYGLPGFILGFVAGNVVGLVVIQIAMRFERLPVFLTDTFYTAAFAALVGVGVGVPWFAAERFPEHVIWWQVGAALVALPIAGAWAAVSLRRLLRAA